MSQQQLTLCGSFSVELFFVVFHPTFIHSFPKVHSTFPETKNELEIRTLTLCWIVSKGCSFCFWSKVLLFKCFSKSGGGVFDLYVDKRNDSQQWQTHSYLKCSDHSSVVDSIDNRLVYLLFVLFENCFQTSTQQRKIEKFCTNKNSYDPSTIKTIKLKWSDRTHHSSVEIHFVISFTRIECECLGKEKCILRVCTWVGENQLFVTFMLDIWYSSIYSQSKWFRNFCMFNNSFRNDKFWWNSVQSFILLVQLWSPNEFSSIWQLFVFLFQLLSSKISEHFFKVSFWVWIRAALKIYFQILNWLLYSITNEFQTTLFSIFIWSINCNSLGYLFDTPYSFVIFLWTITSIWIPNWRWQSWWYLRQRKLFYL